MRRLNIQANGHNICLEACDGMDIFHEDIKDMLRGNAINKTASIDGILELVLSRSKNRDLFIRRDNGKKILRGTCGIKFTVSPLNRIRELRLIMLHAINKFSLQCSMHTGSLFFHASSLEKNGRGYMFIGKGGSGKSTICKISKNTDILHDDSAVVRKKQGVYFLFSPFDINRKEVSRPRNLHSIFFIKKSKTNAIQKLSLNESLKASFEHCKNLAPYGRSPLLYEALFDLFKNVPSYSLRFKKDNSFWRTIERGHVK